MSLRTALLTLVAMTAFAANSLLCRLALAEGAIDAASFTSIRLLSGATALTGILLWTQPGRPRLADFDGVAVLALFAYAACFSFAYTSLAAGTGALILFGAVQLSMLGAGIKAGERLTPLSWVGLALALGGLVYLVSPGLSAPSPVGAALMGVAGLAWGIYSLRGRRAAHALHSTAANFVLSVPLTLLLSLLMLGSARVSTTGVTLAIASGALASGLGYAIWYAALRGLNATRAASVQLSVPVIAAVAAVPLLAEPLSARLIIASVAVLGGIGLVFRQRAVRAHRGTAEEAT